MKKPNSETIAAQLHAEREKHQSAIDKLAALATRRANAERDGVAALRAHAAAISEAQVDVDVHARHVGDLTASLKGALTAEREAVRTEAYAKVKSARETVIERIEKYRTEISAKIAELQEVARDAEDAISEVNRNLPAGAAQIPPLEYALRRSPHGSLIGPNDPLYWFGEPRPRPSKPDNGGVVLSQPSTEPQGFAARIRAFTLDHLRAAKPTSTEVNAARPAEHPVEFNPHRRQFVRPAHLG